MERHVLLCGLSGAGKSTVGRLLAAELGVDFLDLDAEIERVAGRPIPAIFEQEGETGFRGLEAAALAAALEGPPWLVIAAGGGALVSPENRARALRRATVVWLEVSVDVAAERVARSEIRPLAGHDPKERLSALLRARESSYAQAHLRVDADPDDSAAVAESIRIGLGEAGA